MALADPLRSATPGSIATDRSPTFSLPLRYFLLGIASYLVAMVGVAAFGGELATATWSPHGLALVHLLTLGSLMAMIMGASYQLVPVVLLATIWSEPLGKGSFWLYLSGLLALVAGFWTWHPALLGTGGTLVVAGLAAFLLNVTVSLARGATWSVIGAYMGIALAMLVAAGTVGFLRTVAYARPDLSVALPNALAAHAHLAAYGCASLLIFGVSYQLVSMFALTHAHERLSRPVLGLAALGVTTLAVGAFAQLPWAWKVGSAMMALGSWLWGYDVWRLYRHRTRKALDVGLTLAYSALIYLGIASLIGLALAWSVPLPIPGERLAAAYAAIGLGGWISFSMLGWLYKIMPFLAWYHRYSQLVGKKKVPMIKDLFDERPGWVGFWLSHAGMIVLALALAMGLGAGVRIGGLLLALGALPVGAMFAQTLRR